MVNKKRVGMMVAVTLLIGVLLCMAVTVAISLVNPLLIEEAIDHYIANKDMKGLMGLGLFALGLNIIFIIMVKIRMYVMAVVSNKILLRIRQRSNPVFVSTAPAGRQKLKCHLFPALDV